jgi:hypothetical protein
VLADASKHSAVSHGYAEQKLRELAPLEAEPPKNRRGWPAQRG